jgi:hypothetical protein
MCEFDIKAYLFTCLCVSWRLSEKGPVMAGPSGGAHGTPDLTNFLLVYAIHDLQTN